MRVIKSKSRLTCIAINCLIDDKRKNVELFTKKDENEEAKSSGQSSEVGEEDEIDDDEFGESELDEMDEDEFGESDLDDEYSSHDEEQIKKNNELLMKTLQQQKSQKRQKK